MYNKLTLNQKDFVVWTLGYHYWVLVNNVSALVGVIRVLTRARARNPSSKQARTQGWPAGGGGGGGGGGESSPSPFYVLWSLCVTVLNPI